MDYNDNFNYTNGRKDLFSMVNDLANKFNGKSTNELMLAILSEAKKGKKNGTLTNSDIDSFYNTLYPVLDEKQKKALEKIVADLKAL